MVMLDKEQDEQRLARLAAREARIRELESELARERIEQYKDVRASIAFRQSLPTILSDLEAEKIRLQELYTRMQSMHKESQRHQKRADETCAKWMAQTQTHLAMFMP